jgi:hypothetical protein
MQQNKREKTRDTLHCLLLSQLATPHWRRYSVEVMWERYVRSYLRLNSWPGCHHNVLFAGAVRLWLAPCIVDLSWYMSRCLGLVHLGKSCPKAPVGVCSRLRTLKVVRRFNDNSLTFQGPTHDNHGVRSLLRLNRQESSSYESYRKLED